MIRRFVNNLWRSRRKWREFIIKRKFKKIVEFAKVRPDNVDWRNAEMLFHLGMAAERFRFAAFLAQPRAAKTLNII